jgi:hypothetical protein
MGGPLDWFKKIYESEKKNFNRGLNRIKKEGIIQGSLGMVSDAAEMMLRDAGLGNAADAVDEYTNYEIEKFNDRKILSDVAQELGLQKGGEPQLTGQYAVANAKLNVGLATRAKESKDPIVEEKQVRTSSVNSTSYKTPELDR